MTTTILRPDTLDPRLRSSTPPPIHDAVEYLPSSTLIRNITESLAIPREPLTSHQGSKAGSKKRRTTNPKPRARKNARNAPAPAPLSPWQQTHTSTLMVPQSPIDTLAAVANAENSTISERPSKRARSEALASPDFADHRVSSGGYRPATSYLPSGAWGANVERRINSAIPLHSSSTAYTREEQLVAEGLLNLFHSTRSPAQEQNSFALSPRADVLTHNGRTNIFGSSSPFMFAGAHSIRQPLLRVHGEYGYTSASSRRQDAVDDHGYPRASSGQTHTPPDEHEMDNRGTHEDRKAAEFKHNRNAGGLSQQRIPELADRATNGHQLHSPQSLPAESDKIVVKKRRARVKPELVRPLQEGLGISVAPNDQIDVNGAGASEIHTSKMDEETKCEKCGFFANSLIGDTMDWLQCDGCAGWLHFACSTFSRKEIDLIDKFYCFKCKPRHGPTTFVRKSSRKKANVDYSSLNEGRFSTVEELFEHRYVKHFKNKDMKYIQQETFARIAPEDLTLEYLERLPCMSEPIVIPKELNPRPFKTPAVSYPSQEESTFTVPENEEDDQEEQEVVEDVAQDRLGMVIPEGLTVRRVAEIHGKDMPLEVIDVKSQEGDSKKWTVGQWADYYESPRGQAIRNVISLEVSYSPLGKMLRRPKIVRDLDLQDAVWPDWDDKRKAVKFYVLMSIADCYTDFHIDFGGSSVYYHVLKGRKVFFFIPPTKQNLKKYEDWCVSPAQSETFLPDQTKECFRVDLEAGDTMLIPSGWIHAVWTPDDSLVIGGNFLTRMHLGMQLRINELEKNTGVDTKYRYPFFQKVQWYTVAKYLEDDPLPERVEEALQEGVTFRRDVMIWQEFHQVPDAHWMNPFMKNARYYSRAETEGWPELLRFIFRTVLIHLDRLEGISQKTRAAVSRSIPKNITDPLESARKFACWIAWKNGDELIPDWAFPDAELPTRLDQKSDKPEKAATVPTEPRVTRRATSTNAESRTSHRLGPKKVVCDSCREKKIACKHVDAQLLATLTANGPPSPTESIKEREPNGDGVVSKQRDRELVGKLSMNQDGKRRWGKACVECRRSKRRCIHDETGKIDPNKQKQLAASRAGQKRKYSGLDDEPIQHALDAAPDYHMDIDPSLLAMGEDAIDMDEDDYYDNLDMNHVEDSIEAHNPLVRDDIGLSEPKAGSNPASALQISGMYMVEAAEQIKTEVEPLTNGASTIADRQEANVMTGSHNQQRNEASRGSQNPDSSTSSKISPSIGVVKGPLIIPTSASPEEEESLKIAIELQAQEFGLRTRRSAG